MRAYGPVYRRSISKHSDEIIFQLKCRSRRVQSATNSSATLYSYIMYLCPVQGHEGSCLWHAGQHGVFITFWRQEHSTAWSGHCIISSLISAVWCRCGIVSCASEQAPIQHPCWDNDVTNPFVCWQSILPDLYVLERVVWRSFLECRGCSRRIGVKYGGYCSAHVFLTSSGKPSNDYDTRHQFHGMRKKMPAFHIQHFLSLAFLQPHVRLVEGWTTNRICQRLDGRNGKANRFSFCVALVLN